MVQLNNGVYARCPRAISLDSFESRYFVNLFLQCHNRGILPSPGGPGDQTQFTTQLFDYLSTLLHAHNEAQQAKNAKPKA